MERFTKQVENLKMQWIEDTKAYMSVRNLKSVDLSIKLGTKRFESYHDSYEVVDVTINGVNDDGSLLCETMNSEEYTLTLNDLEIYTVAYILDLLYSNKFTEIK